MTEPRPRTVDDVTELLQLLDLRAVQFYEVSGVRAEEGQDDSAGFTMALTERHGPTALEARFRMTVRRAQATFLADLGTRYETTVPLVVKPFVIAEFIERVAIMAAFPFLREAVASTAARLEVPVPLLGLLRPGQFSITRTEDADLPD